MTRGGHEHRFREKARAADTTNQGEKKEMQNGTGIALIDEMLETSRIIENFNPSSAAPVAESIRETHKLFLTGEGSSRIFPAKNAICEAIKSGVPITVHTDGCFQASEYDLSKWTVLASSNSGRTKETVTLMRKLRAGGHQNVFGITANAGSPVNELSSADIVLKCGAEKAVAATKSVVEQALIEHAAVAEFTGMDKFAAGLSAAGRLSAEIMSAGINPDIVEALASAQTLFFAGRNDGVAEELALKTNEITRKRSGYFEGTYALHGVEEVLDASDTVVFIEPFASEFDAIHRIFEEEVGAKVIAVSSSGTPFPTVTIPSLPGFDAYLRLMAGWNMLAAAGMAEGIDLDHPKRARKIGNEI